MGAHGRRERQGVCLGDVPVVVDSDGDTILDAAVREFFAVMPRAPVNGDHPVVVTGEVVVGHGPPDEMYGSVRLWRQGERLDVAYGPVAARCDAVGVTLTHDGSVEAGDAGRVRAALRGVLHHALAHLLGGRGRLLLHAAAVAREGRAVLLTGPTGAGKSTTAYGAWRAGWSVLADDLVVISPAATGCAVGGLHRQPNAPADVVSADESQAGSTAENDPRRRVLVAVPLDTAWYPLAAIARITHGTEGEGAPARLPAVDAVFQVLGSAPALGHPPVARLAFDLANCIRVAPFFQIELPRPPERRAASIARQLELMMTTAG